jgi:rare lipoprotein A
MVIRWKSRNVTLRTPLGLCLLAGASVVALAAVAITLSTAAVQADARLPRPASVAPPPAPSLSAAPASTAPKKTASPSRAHLLRGIASWYGSMLDGRLTASGERFDMHAMTACHPTLPFGTVVRVLDLRNKKSVVVRINDRGDLAPGRIIDLSYAAAEQLNITEAGLAPVALEIISLGHPRHP